MPQATPEAPTAPAGPSGPSAPAGGRRPLVGVALTIPTLSCSLGIDGGDLFQILALEDLGLDARTIGIGLGFGALSVPVQLWAARMPLWRARRNLQVFLVVAALQCWALALLVTFAAPAGGLAATALAIAVAAEISLSVLYVTAWQPLLSFALTPAERQRLNSQARAVARGLLAGVLLVFGLAGHTTRIGFLVVIGALALVQAVVIRNVPTAARPTPAPPPPDGRDAGHGPPLPMLDGDGRRHPPAKAKPPRVKTRSPVEMRALCLTAGLMAAATWPLFVTYAHDVLWPTVNLGLLATTQLAGGVVAALLWRPTHTALVRRARIAGLVIAGCAGALALVRPPVDGPVDAALTLGALGLSAGAFMVAALALMELVHQVLDHETSVRGLTIFDVVASTSMQVSLLVAGVLVSVSERSTWLLDPYRLYLLAGAGAMAVTMLRRDWPRPRSRRPGRPEQSQQPPTTGDPTRPAPATGS